MSDPNPKSKRPRLEDSTKPVLVQDRRTETMTKMEGALPTELSLAIPFLSVGDLPTLAAVNKAAQQLAKASLKTRLNSEDDCKVLDETGTKKQEMVVYDEDPPQCYAMEKTTFLDFRKLYQNQIATRPTLVEKEGSWYIEIQGKHYPFPQDFSQLDPTQNFRIWHYSKVDHKIILTATVETAEDQNEFGPDYTRSLWSIIYDTTVGQPQPGEPLVNHLVPRIHPLWADCDGGNFGAAFRSGNGKSVAAITEMGTSDWDDISIETCTLTIYNVTDSGLTKVQDLAIGWCHAEYGQLQASLNTGGNLLSIRRTRSQSDPHPVIWELYDLRSNPAKKLFAQAVSTNGCFTVRDVFFTADNELLVELDRHYLDREYANNGEETPMAQYVKKHFSFLKETPAFAKRVIFRYCD